MNEATAAATEVMEPTFLQQYGSIIMIILIIAVFYFMIIRPQKKQEKKQREMLDAIRPGDEIVTIGGIYGKVVTVKDEFVVIESSADKTKIKMAKSSVSRCLTEHEDSSPEVKNDKEDKTEE